jgi:hypothetical protein
MQSVDHTGQLIAILTAITAVVLVLAVSINLDLLD